MYIIIKSDILVNAIMCPSKFPSNTTREGLMISTRCNRSTAKLLAFLTLLTLMASRLFEISPTMAQAPTPLPPTSAPCFQDQCGGDANCVAQDVKVNSLDTFQMIEPCRYAGDTGTYIFKATIQSNATTRYDPMVWIAADGGNALTGSCWKDHLNPITTGTPDLLGGYGPFPSYENDKNNLPLDSCGDIGSLITSYKYIGPITIVCSQAMLDSKTVAKVITWDQNAVANCPANNGCNGDVKCNKEPAPIEINLDIVDLKLTKDASTSAVKPGDTLTFTFTVHNNSQQYKSTGYTITDTLIAGLEYVSASPAVCTKTELVDSRDKITCNVLADLLPSSDAPQITITVRVADNYIGPSTILNEACVSGNEYEHNGTDPLYPSTLTDNCDTANVPTAVDLISFSAHAVDSEIQLDWQTANELDTLGFNLLRGLENSFVQSQAINENLILAQTPGNLAGSSYSYLDSQVVETTIYYYWLEEVTTSGLNVHYGPIIAHLKLPYTQFLPIVRH